MKDSFTKELIELAAQAATIAQLNLVIKARDIQISELEKQLSSANKKLATNKENDRIAEYQRQWEKEEKLEDKN